MNVVDKIILRFIPDKIRLKYYSKLYNNLYERMSLLAARINNGIHPKYDIMKYYNYFVENIDEGSLVLDVGCSNGFLTYKMAKKAKKVVGVDINKNSIAIAIKEHMLENIEYVCSDIMTYEFNEYYDYITLSSVIEHIKDRKKLLTKIKQYTKFLIIRVPMIDRSWLAVYIKDMGFDYRISNSHFIEYTFESFKNEIESAGLKIVSYKINFGEIWALIKS